MVFRSILYHFLKNDANKHKTLPFQQEEKIYHKEYPPLYQ